MKCPYCHQEHPDDAVFCPQTGQRIQEDKLACTENPNCPIHGQRILPLDAVFCPECGAALKKVRNLAKRILASVKKICLKQLIFKRV